MTSDEMMEIYETHKEDGQCWVKRHGANKPDRIAESWGEELRNDWGMWCSQPEMNVLVLKAIADSKKTEKKIMTRNEISPAMKNILQVTVSTGMFDTFDIFVMGNDYGLDEGSMIDHIVECAGANMHSNPRTHKNVMSAVDDYHAVQYKNKL